MSKKKVFLFVLWCFVWSTNSKVNFIVLRVVCTAAAIWFVVFLFTVHFFVYSLCWCHCLILLFIWSFFIVLFYFFSFFLLFNRVHLVYYCVPYTRHGAVVIFIFYFLFFQVFFYPFILFSFQFMFTVPNETNWNNFYPRSSLLATVVSRFFCF